MESVQESRITKALATDNPIRLILIVVILSAVLGIISGYFLSNKNKGSFTTTTLGGAAPAKNPEADTKTFRDFAEGTLKAKPTSEEGGYTEGTHLLERQGGVPVALTSSVVDLSKYEGKKVKVFGETQKALQEGWLMDVGKVEEIK